MAQNAALESLRFINAGHQELSQSFCGRVREREQIARLEKATIKMARKVTPAGRKMAETRDSINDVWGERTHVFDIQVLRLANPTRKVGRMNA